MRLNPGVEAASFKSSLQLFLAFNTACLCCALAFVVSANEIVCLN